MDITDSELKIIIGYLIEIISEGFYDPSLDEQEFDRYIQIVYHLKKIYLLTLDQS